ncbi:DNA helicase, UvrD/REP type [Alteracholeplasma palmae J233]|uniref:DNA 3'-5' helicase n=1 Tax=Alteracholeplasma palmae (strain ATCC 49389 / J233) TaxID=1318466 RepID=U4KJT2_ALTPJ|nr:UvrD-helicase domain-containing protein [Alteracholeplasma palmae]CCV63707.1 DNA helicase, UvrD/REP type [Alteracholeplasma palmae J233]
MLNKKQEEAVTSSDRFIFLLAGAGTGKTRVIVERIKYLLENKITVEEKILSISFTQKSAKELKKRIGKENIKSQTFHSFCLSYLDFKNVLEPKVFNSEELLLISNYKNSLFRKKMPKHYKEYEAYLKNQAGIDYDDILINFLKLKNIPKYDYIFIDEFQDTNPLQYQVLKKLVHSMTNVFSVGDPDQSIYAFRGSDIKIIDKYIKDYKAKIYLLDENYRCNKKVLLTANKLISKNKKRFNKALYPIKTKDGLVEIVYTKDRFKTIKTIIKRENFLTILVRSYHSHRNLESYLEENYVFNYQLLTIHQAKGLEFDAVLILGTSEMVRTNTQKELEEERRILFVALTRAKEKVYLLEKHPNRFLKEMKTKE